MQRQRVGAHIRAEDKREERDAQKADQRQAQPGQLKRLFRARQQAQQPDRQQAKQGQLEEVRGDHRLERQRAKRQHRGYQHHQRQAGVGVEQQQVAERQARQRGEAGPDRPKRNCGAAGQAQGDRKQATPTVRSTALRSILLARPNRRFLSRELTKIATALAEFAVALPGIVLQIL